MGKHLSNRIETSEHYDSNWRSKTEEQKSGRTIMSGGSWK